MAPSVGAPLYAALALHLSVPPAAATVAVGEVVPAVAVYDREGAPISTTTLRGRVTVLSFWATWCAPCRAELPLLDALHDRLPADRADVVGVALDTPSAPAVALARHLGLDFTLLYDPRASLSGALDPHQIPATYVLDATGAVRFVHLGALSAEGVQAIGGEVETLLGGAS